MFEVTPFSFGLFSLIHVSQLVLAAVVLRRRTLLSSKGQYITTLCSVAMSPLSLWIFVVVWPVLLKHDWIGNVFVAFCRRQSFDYVAVCRSVSVELRVYRN